MVKLTKSDTAIENDMVMPKLAKNLGKAQKEFKDGLADGQKEADKAKEAEKAKETAKAAEDADS